MSVSREHPVTPSVAAASAQLASMASSVRAGVSRAHSEKAATCGVAATVGHPVTPSAASACAHQGAREPRVTWIAKGAALGPAVPCAVSVQGELTVTPSAGSATVWMATWGPRAGKVGPPRSLRACPQPRAQWPHGQSPADRYPALQQGHKALAEAAPTMEALLPSSS